MVKGVGRKIFRGRGQRKRRPKNSTIKPLPGGPTEKDRKITKNRKILCMKIQRATAPLPLAADAHAYGLDRCL